MEIEGRSFIAKGSYEREESPGIGALYAGYPVSTEKKVLKTNVRYEGVVTGYGIEYKLYIKEEGKKSSLLGTSLFSGPSKEGLMVIADDKRKIRVYEKGTKEKEKFYELQEK